jgi:hypothetical protein
LEIGNPYKANPGVELDDWLHEHFFRDISPEALAYSTNERAAEKLRARIKSLYGYKVHTGTTNVRTAKFFARLETGASTSTETLAETLPLAISRLAMVVALRRDPEVQ